MAMNFPRITPQPLSSSETEVKGHYQYDRVY